MERYTKAIDRILNNKLGKSNRTKEYAKPLTAEQLKALKDYKEYYEIKPSSKGGNIKISSVHTSLDVIRRLGVFLEGIPFKPCNCKGLKYCKKDLEYQKKLIQFISLFKSDYTQANMKVIIRSFYKFLYGITKKHDFPKIVDSELLVPQKPKGKIRPSDLPTQEEYVKMLNSCSNFRDKFIVSIWFEIGARAGELVSANIGTIEFFDGGAKLYIEESKTEEGFIPLVNSAPYLQEWLLEHPFKDNPSAPLLINIFHKKYYGKRLQKNSINQLLQSIAKKAGVKKRIFTHLGRHAAITRLKQAGFPDSDNASIHGISESTLQNYTHRLRKESCDNYFGMKNGKKDNSAEEQQKKLLPKKCSNPECNRINPAERSYCKYCGKPLDLKTFLEKEKKASRMNQIFDLFMDEKMKNPSKSTAQIMDQIFEGLIK